MGMEGWAGVGDIRAHFQVECFYAPMNLNLLLKYSHSWVLGRILSPSTPGRTHSLIFLDFCKHYKIPPNTA